MKLGVFPSATIASRFRLRVNSERIFSISLSNYLKRIKASIPMEVRNVFGPGYRVYFGRDGESIVIILCGGDRSTQAKDIRFAQDYWADNKKRSKGA